MNKLKSIWQIEDLRKKILFTLLLILVFRLGCSIPVPFVSNTALDSMFSNDSIFGYMNMLSGGALSRCAFFALGVSPYINSSIITQLLCVALPSWEALQKETTGKDKLDEYTKRIALAMAAIMSIGYYFVLRNYGALEYTAGKSGFFAAVVIMATFLAGSQLSVWIGGRIDEFGIGNGVSILIFAGIVSRWTDINTIAHNIAVQVESGNWLYSLVGIGMVVAMLFAVWFVSYSDGAERRIPVQYAARKYNARGQASYIPVKLLMSGVMPIIFAGVIMSIPATVDMFVDATKHVRLHSVLSVFSSGSWIYYAVYVILIALFNFFYTRASSAGNRGVMQGYSLSEGDGKRNLVNPDEVQHLDKEQILIMTNGQNMLEAKRFGFIHHPLFNDPHFVPTKWAELPKTADLYPNARKHDAIESRESSFGDIQRQKEINTDITQKRSEERMKPRLSKKDLLATDEPAPKKKNAFKK